MSNIDNKNSIMNLIKILNFSLILVLINLNCLSNTFGSEDSKRGSEVEGNGTSAKATCPICKLEFKRWDYLNDHLDGSHKYIKYSYLNCGKTMKNMRSIIRHVSEKHPDHSVFPCPECSKVFGEKEQLESHFRSEKHGEKVTCLVCNLRMNKVIYEMHKEAHSKFSVTSSGSISSNRDESIISENHSTASKTKSKQTRSKKRKQTQEQFVCRFKKCNGKTFSSNSDLVSHQEERHLAMRKPPWWTPGIKISDYAVNPVKEKDSSLSFSDESDTLEHESPGEEPPATSFFNIQAEDLAPVHALLNSYRIPLPSVTEKFRPRIKRYRNPSSSISSSELRIDREEDDVQILERSPENPHSLSPVHLSPDCLSSPVQSFDPMPSFFRNLEFKALPVLLGVFPPLK